MWHPCLSHPTPPTCRKHSAFHTPHPPPSSACAARPPSERGPCSPGTAACCSSRQAGRRHVFVAGARHAWSCSGWSVQHARLSCTEQGHWGHAHRQRWLASWQRVSTHLRLACICGAASRSTSTSLQQRQGRKQSGWLRRQRGGTGSLPALPTCLPLGGCPESGTHLVSEVLSTSLKCHPHSQGPQLPTG